MGEGKGVGVKKGCGDMQLDADLGVEVMLILNIANETWDITQKNEDDNGHGIKPSPSNGAKVNHISVEKGRVQNHISVENN